jgi:hypothetical protein
MALESGLRYSILWLYGSCLPDVAVNESIQGSSQ